MKLLSSLIIIFAFVLSISAQEKAAKWTRIESEDKSFSISLPPHFVVDAEKRERGQRYEINGYLNGVKMRLKVYAERNAKSRLKQARYMPGAKVREFSANGFNVKRITAEEFSKNYFETIELAADGYFYSIYVKAGSKEKEELKRFLYSINISGKQLFQQKAKPDFAEETISMGALKTNPDVFEALKRKSEKTKIKVSYEADYSDIESDDYNEKFSRPPIILERPAVSWRPEFNRDLSGNGTYVVKLKVNYLANGQIGDIISYSGTKSGFTEAYIEATRKIKFIPAQIDGKNVDAAIVEEYTLEFFTAPGLN